MPQQGGVENRSRVSKRSGILLWDLGHSWTRGNGDGRESDRWWFDEEEIFTQIRSEKYMTTMSSRNPTEVRLKKVGLYPVFMS